MRKDETSWNSFCSARLVKESKNWDYSKAELKDWNIKNIINDFMEDEDEALEMMNHLFKEPCNT